MFSISKFRSFINNSTEKINNKLDKIEAKRLSGIAMKEELLAQKIKKKEEQLKKKEIKKNHIKEKGETFKKSITEAINSLVFKIKNIFYKILRKLVIIIRNTYIKMDYKKSVKNHKQLINKIYKSAGIDILSGNHDVDLLTKDNTKTAIEGEEPPRHKYINKHHLDYWVKDNKITEIPFENTLEIMCDLFATAYNKTNNIVDYTLILELLKEKTEEYFISNVLVNYFIDSISHAQQNKLIAPDYIYCLNKYNTNVLF